MTTPEKIREVTERNVQMLNLKPERGHLKVTTKAKVAEGLRCEIEEGPWRLKADLPVKAGGDETGPTPGMLGRGALASCLAMGITLWAARLEIPVNSVEVEVQVKFDVRGELGVGADPQPGYQEIRYQISIDSPAGEDALLRLVETAERYSPYLELFSGPQKLEKVLCLNGREV